jgi:hypothetical protein
LETNRNNQKKRKEPNKTAMKKCMISRVGLFFSYVLNQVTGYVHTKVRKTAKNVFESIGLYRGKITPYNFVKMGGLWVSKDAEFNVEFK